MTHFSIIVFGSGEIYWNMFDAIAATIGSNAYERLLKVSVMLAFVTMMISLITKRDMVVIIRWLSLYYVVMYVLIGPGATLIIEDKLDFSAKPVDNVPYGLALLANYTSKIGLGLTELVEQNYTPLQDLSYEQTGMVMNARMAIAARSFVIADVMFDRNMNEFLKQCVWSRINNDVYKIHQLLHSPDAWQELASIISNSSYFYYDSNTAGSSNNALSFMSCKDGYGSLNNRWTSIISNAIAANATRFSSDPRTAVLRFRAILQASYNQLLNAKSIGPDQIAQQYLMFSELDRSIVNLNSTTNAVASLEAYNFQKAQAQNRSMMKTMGDMAAYWLPIMRNVFEIILYGMFIFVLLLGVFPNGYVVILNYFRTLLWLQLWAPLFAIVNMIISFYAAKNSLAVAPYGLTLDAISGLTFVNSDIVTLAGYMSMSVPMLSFCILRGMENSFTQVAQHFGGSIQSAMAYATSGVRPPLQNPLDDAAKQSQTSSSRSNGASQNGHVTSNTSPPSLAELEENMVQHNALGEKQISSLYQNDGIGENPFVSFIANHPDPTMPGQLFGQAGAMRIMQNPELVKSYAKKYIEKN